MFVQIIAQKTGAQIKYVGLDQNESYDLEVMTMMLHDLERVLSIPQDILSIVLQLSLNFAPELIS